MRHSCWILIPRCGYLQVQVAYAPQLLSYSATKGTLLFAFSTHLCRATCIFDFRTCFWIRGTYRDHPADFSRSLKQRWPMLKGNRADLETDRMSCSTRSVNTDTDTDTDPGFLYPQWWFQVSPLTRWEVYWLFHFFWGPWSAVYSSSVVLRCSTVMESSSNV